MGLVKETPDTRNESLMFRKGRKLIYLFGNQKADGSLKLKNLLGGKGAGLAEMTNLGIPVPPGFTIPTFVCRDFLKTGKLPKNFNNEIKKGIKFIEKITGQVFGSKDNLLLLSVRSGARSSMPGMMETVLNIGLNDITREGLIQKTNNPRFVYDAQRRLIQMYSDVVMEKAELEPMSRGPGIGKILEYELARIKNRKGYKFDVELSTDDLKELIEIYKEKVQRVLKRDFPSDPWEQLLNAIRATFKSWNGKRAVEYRRIEGIPDDWGTAVTVQAMVFGNKGEASGTGVCFTRNPATGENLFYGEWLPNAQGEDVVAGVRTPNPLNEAIKSEQNRHLPSLAVAMPEIYDQLVNYGKRLEHHFKDMLDIEFTIEEGRLWILQVRVGKRHGRAAIRIAVDMKREGLITKQTAIMRVPPRQLTELLYPIVNPEFEKKKRPIASGLPAGPGGACGRVVFTAQAALELSEKKEAVILVREETNPEDIAGMRAASGILTARGGMTSHAALVARGWGKCCIVGAEMINIDLTNRSLSVGEKIIREGDWLTLDGTKGYVYENRLPLLPPQAEKEIYFQEFLKWCDEFRRLRVRANADNKDDAKRARELGAQGIGLFRTEHMFYGAGAEEPLFILRKMIFAMSDEERKKALEEIFPFFKKNIKETLLVMAGLPVTIRLLDPPLHEFIPKEREGLEKLSTGLGLSFGEIEKRSEKLREVNPMMGHRGVRLGVTYQEITEMQVRAIFESAAELLKEGKRVFPEIKIPFTAFVEEIRHQRNIIKRVYKEVLRKYSLKRIPYLFGTMIEIPSAAFLADEIAKEVDFFSLGTNDMTQLVLGLSRDDIGSFLGDYLSNRIISFDPFETIDPKGVGEIVKLGIERGKKQNPRLKIGICGEHAGDPRSIEFFNSLPIDYISASPFRVPVARLALAQAVIKEKLYGRKRVVKKIQTPEIKETE